jgi:hypothetical protein
LFFSFFEILKSTRWKEDRYYTQPPEEFVVVVQQLREKKKKKKKLLFFFFRLRAGLAHAMSGLIHLTWPFFISFLFKKFYLFHS